METNLTSEVPAAELDESKRRIAVETYERGSSMVCNFKELCAEIDPQRGTRVESREDIFPKAMPLEALRGARQLTQAQLAQLLRVSQGAVSKVERRTDMFVSTLRSYVRAIGGHLQIRAVFPEGEVLINQFNDPSADPGMLPEGAVSDRKEES
jgi:DNA-binding XRE family transcriptional regulator